MVSFGPMVEEFSFRCLIRTILAGPMVEEFHSVAYFRNVFFLMQIFSYITVLLDFLLIFCEKIFKVDVVQPQYFGHVAWLDSLPLSDVVFSFVCTLFW